MSSAHEAQVVGFYTIPFTGTRSALVGTDIALQSRVGDFQ
jgi:hypothetical protein